MAQPAQNLHAHGLQVGLHTHFSGQQSPEGRLPDQAAPTQLQHKANAEPANPSGLPRSMDGSNQPMAPPDKGPVPRKEAKAAATGQDPQQQLRPTEHPAANSPDGLDDLMSSIVVLVLPEKGEATGQGRGPPSTRPARKDPESR